MISYGYVIYYDILLIGCKEMVNKIRWLAGKSLNQMEVSCWENHRFGMGGFSSTPCLISERYCSKTCGFVLKCWVYSQ